MRLWFCLCLIACHSRGAPHEVLLNAQEIPIQTDRADVTVSGLSLAIRCVRKPYPTACDDFAIDDVAAAFEQPVVDLEAGDTGTFQLPALTIRWSSAGQGYLCIGVKAWLAEVHHQCDSDLYEVRDDRYSLLNYCSVQEHPTWSDARYFDNQQTADLDAFHEQLADGLQVRLHDGPLPQCTPP